MNERLGPANILKDNVLKFVKLGTGNGVANYTLEGPVNVPTMFDSFVFLYCPNPLNLEYKRIGIVVTSEKRTPIEIYNKVLELGIPERIKNLNIKPIKAMEEAYGVVFSQRLMPHIVIALGKTMETQEDAALLFSVPGLPPQDSLALVQQGARERKPRFN